MSQFVLKVAALWMAFSFAFSASVATLRAADPDGNEGEPAPALPTDSSLWLNSTPYTWDQLKGKGVCLWFFNADPTGATELAKVMASAKAHAMDPVVYIAVAMGTKPDITERFLQEAKITLPTLCDPVHDYSRKCDMHLKNAADDSIIGSEYCSAIVMHDGKLIDGWFDSAEQTAMTALQDAKWVTSPKDIPEPLWPLWRAVEFQKYGEAQPLFKKSLNSGPAAQREAAKKLQTQIQELIESRAAQARTAYEADEKWTAYSRIASIQTEFRGYEIPKDLDGIQKKLLRTPQVKAGVQAEKQLPILAESLESGTPAQRKKAQAQLEKIKTDFPDTPLAERAKVLLETPQSLPK